MARTIENTPSTGSERAPLIRRAVLVEWLTISWMTVESSVAIWSGIVARSVTLTAFGLDSVIEMMSAGVLIWRLNWELGHDCADEQECQHLDRVELRATRT